MAGRARSSILRGGAPRCAMALKDAIKVQVPCPKCGHQTFQSLAWLEHNASLTCPGCSARIQIKGDDPGKAVKSLDELEEEVRRLAGGHSE